MYYKIKDLTGQIFGRLTVLEQNGWYTIPCNGKRQAKWRCICDCIDKNEITTTSGSLVQGYTKSCGCLKTENTKKAKRINPQEHAWKEQYSRYKQSAIVRGLLWELEICEFKILSTLPCTYCGTLPAKNEIGKNAYIQKNTAKGFKIDLEFADSKIIYTNGIDRVDSLKGYSVDNSVPCCKYCNYAKRERSAEEWLLWIDRLVKYQVAKG